MKYFLLTLTFFLLFSGCRKPNQHPENSDPIIRDLQSRLKSAEVLMSEYESDYIRAKESWEKAETNSREQKETKSKFFSAEKKLRKAKQMVNYFKIRINLRTIEGRSEYIEAFKQEKEHNWPNPKDIRQYNLDRKVSSELE